MKGMIKRVLQRILPKQQLSRLALNYKTAMSTMRLWTFRSFSQTQWMANVFYSLFSFEFVREHRATLAGKKRYFESLHEQQRSSYLLRRNVHRLEKGLIMPQRREVFATDFIGETVQEYKRMALNNLSDLQEHDELKWATDVLREYFEVVDHSHPKIATNYRVFVGVLEKTENGAEKDAQRFIPYARDFSTQLIDYEDFYALTKRRRSVRFYESTPPPRDLVDKAILAAMQAPSACNRQPFTFRLYDEPEMVKKVASIPAGTKTFYQQLPAVAVVVGHLSAYYRERDRHAIYVDGSLAVMSFVYALETLGMSSCVINWGDEEPAESRMAKLIGLNPDDRVLMLVAYGFPQKDLMVPYSSKKDLQTIRTYNEY